MIFGGLQKTSLIDYPEKLSCVLFFSGCNFECPYCHNPELARGIALEKWPEDEVFDFLEKRKNFLEGVVISGGEPCLHPDLIRICQTIQAIGYPIKLDTNGSCPDVLKNLIAKGLIDYVAMDIKTSPDNYPLYIQKEFDPGLILSSIDIIKESGLSHEFRTTCIRPLISEAILEKISYLIRGADLYVLQRFVFSRVLNSDFFKENDYTINEDDLLRLQVIAQKCIKTRIR